MNHFFKKTKLALLKEAPMLLTVAGISGFASAAFMALKVGSAVDSILERNAPAIPESGIERRIEEAKLVLPVLAPTIGMMFISTAMILGSHRVHRRRYLALNSLYVFSQQYLTNLQERVLEEVGAKKYDKIRNDVSAPPDGLAVPMIISGDNVLFYDTFSSRYFQMGSVEHVRTAINDINTTLFQEMFVSVNDFYYEVGLDGVSYGDDIGWAIEQGAVEIVLGTAMTKDNRPCVTIYFNAEPKHIYDRLGR